MKNTSSIQASQPIVDFRAYEAAPGVSVILLPNSPIYTHVAVSNDFIRVSGMRRQDVIGKGHFEIFPKSPDDPNFTGEQNLKASFEFILEQKKPHEIPIQRYDIPKGDGTFSQKYWKISNAPILGDSGEVLYIIHSAIDITDQIKAQQKVEDIRGIEKAYNLFMNAPVMISIVKGKDYIIELANKGMLQVWGRDNDAIGKPLLKAIPELEGQGFIELLDEVRKTGKPYHAYEKPATLIRNGREEVLYFNFVYQPYYEDTNNKIAEGVIAIAHDVTEQVFARKKLAEVIEHLNFRNALFEAQNEATPDGVLVVDAKGKMLLHNKRFAEIWNMPQEIIDSKNDEAALQHAITVLTDPEGFIDRVTNLYRNGREKSYDLIHFKDGRIVERNGTPIVAENGWYYGWAWYFRDITDRIKQEQKFRTVVEQAPDPILILKGENMVLEVANEALFRLWNVDKNALGKAFLEILPEMKDQGFLELLRHVYHTGLPYHGFEIPALFKDANEKTRTTYFNFTYQPYHEANGEITGVLVTATDVTGQVTANQKLLKSEQNLRNTILQAPVAMCILLGSSHVIEVANDAMIELWGKPAEHVIGKPFFESQPDARDQGLEQLLSAVYHTGEPFKANERAVELVRNGKRETVYQNFVYEPYRDTTGNILGVLAISIDVTAQVLARQKIEEMVKQRTNELAQANDALTRTNHELSRSNENLQEFAYAASHDLKEPIRKIRVFSERLGSNLAERLSEEEKHLFERMNGAAKRMTSLIDDLLSYSQVSLGSEISQEVNLNELIDLVLNDLDLEIEEKSASIKVDKLFTLKGHQRQLQQAFQNLISNSLKYSKPGVPPQITVTSRKVKAGDVSLMIPHVKPNYIFHACEIKDNGIGFEQKDAERIFNVFTRLHANSDYRGTGVGLSIVQKVIRNHNGLITAESKVGEGTSFKIYLPGTEAQHHL